MASGVSCVAVLVVLAAACGGGSEPGDDDAVNGDNGGMRDPGVSSPSNGAGPAGEPEAALPSEECGEAGELLARAFFFAVGRVGMTPDELKGLEDDFRPLRDAASEPLRRDIELITDTFRDVADEIERSGWSAQSATPPPPSVVDAYQAMNSPAFSDAFERVEAWVDRSC